MDIVTLKFNVALERIQTKQSNANFIDPFLRLLILLHSNLQNVISN